MTVWIAEKQGLSWSYREYLQYGPCRLYRNDCQTEPWSVFFFFVSKKLLLLLRHVVMHKRNINIRSFWVGWCFHSLSFTVLSFQPLCERLFQLATIFGKSVNQLYTLALGKNFMGHSFLFMCCFFLPIQNRLAWGPDDVPKWVYRLCRRFSGGTSRHKQSRQGLTDSGSFSREDRGSLLRDPFLSLFFV